MSPAAKTMFIHFYTCLAAYTAYRDGEEPNCRIGRDVANENSPSRLAMKLKARLLGPQTIDLHWLSLAVRLLEARPNVGDVVVMEVAHA